MWHASERGDPRVQLLSDALSVSRSADLELGRVHLAAKRVLLALQEQFGTGQQALVPTITPPAQPTASVIPEYEREALTTNITNLERKRSELETLYEIAQDLNSTLEFDDVLRLAMDKVIRVVGAERGFIVLVNPETGSIEFKIARDKQARTIGKGAFEISRSTVERVVKTRKPLLWSSVNEDKQYMDNIFASMANGVITTNSAGIITTFNLADLLHNAPLQHEHGTIVPHSIDCGIPGRGMVNLDLHVSSLRDQETGAPIGMALVIDDRTDIKRAKAEAKEIRDIFGAYVHPSVVSRLIADPQALTLGGETREITVLFADIRGSTRLGEITPPEQMMNVLNGYWEKMVEAIWSQGGTITAFLGDGLMAIFNAPLAQEDHALRAVRAALGMREGAVMAT